MEDNHHKKIKTVGIVIAIFVLIFALLVFWGIKNNSIVGLDKSDFSWETDAPTPNFLLDENSQGSQENTVPKSSSLDNAWKVFQEFLLKAQAKDIDGVRLLTYKQSEACADLEREEECLARMDTVYELGKDLRKQDFIHIWEDKSQIILSTDFQREESPELVGFVRGFIYLVRDDFTGSIKILTFNPAKGWFHSPRETDTPEFIEEKLQAMILDSDQDGLTDQQETCTGIYFEDPECTNTDPFKKDTNGNGWWDGIEYYMNRS